MNGARAEISTSRKCEPERWNAKAGKVISTKEDVRTLNAYLEKMKADVYAAHSRLSVEGATITADSIKCRFLGKEEKAHTIMEAIEIHNNEMATLVGKQDYAEGTLPK